MRLPDEFARYLSSAESRGKAGSIVLADNAVIDISATAIRGRVREGKPFAELVTPDVARYVERYGLYRTEVSN